MERTAHGFGRWTGGMGGLAVLAKKKIQPSGEGRPAKHVDLPKLRFSKNGNHAYRRLPVFLRVRKLPPIAAPKARRLLRFLLLWFGKMPADTGWRKLLLKLGKIVEQLNQVK